MKKEGKKCNKFDKVNNENKGKGNEYELEGRNCEEEKYTFREEKQK